MKIFPKILLPIMLNGANIEIRGGNIMKKNMTTKELCSELRVHRNTILRWREEGMPYYNVGRSCRYDLEDVLVWVRNKK